MASEQQVAHYQRQAALSMGAGAVFSIAGGTYSLEEMLAANAEDEGVCDWLLNAEVGVPCSLGGEYVVRIA
jgi:hypothetical protein